MTADLQYERRAARGVDAQWSCPHELITVTPPYTFPAGTTHRLRETVAGFTYMHRLFITVTRKSTSFHVMHPQGLILFSN